MVLSDGNFFLDFIYSIRLWFYLTILLITCHRLVKCHSNSLLKVVNSLQLFSKMTVCLLHVMYYMAVFFFKFTWFCYIVNSFHLLHQFFSCSVQLHEFLIAFDSGSKTFLWLIFQSIWILQRDQILTCLLAWRYLWPWDQLKYLCSFHWSLWYVILSFSHAVSRGFHYNVVALTTRQENGLHRIPFLLVSLLLFYTWDKVDCNQ